MRALDRLHALAELSGNPIVTLNATGHIVGLNFHAQKLLGQPPEGSNFFDTFVGTELRAKARVAFLDVVQSRAIAKFHYELVSSNAEPLHLKWVIVPPDHSDEDVYLIARNSGHEEMARLFDQSAKLVDAYRSALDLSAIVAIVDPHDDIIYANEKFCDVSRYPLHELVGKSLQAIAAVPGDEAVFARVWQVISSGSVWRGELMNRTKTGDRYWVDATVVPFLNPHGVPYQYVWICFNISEKKEAEALVHEESMRVQHMEKMVSLGELAAGIAHELGNPLAAITAWLEVLSSQLTKGAFDAAAFKSTVSGVMNNTRRMSKIIRGMLTYARDGSQDPFAFVSVNRLIADVKEYSSHRLSKLGISLRVKAAEAFLEVECRETEISQVLVNLLLNAGDAVRDSAERWIEIEIETWEEGGGIAISVTDSGAGIHPDVHHKILEPFFTTKPPGKGTGLGLSIARKFAEAHHGSLSFDPSAKHTRFVLRLPRRQPSERF